MTDYQSIREAYQGLDDHDDDWPYSDDDDDDWDGFIVDDDYTDEWEEDGPDSYAEPEGT